MLYIFTGETFKSWRAQKVIVESVNVNEAIVSINNNQLTVDVAKPGTNCSYNERSCRFNW